MQRTLLQQKPALRNRLAVGRLGRASTLVPNSEAVFLTRIGIMDTVYIGGLTAANHSLFWRCFSDATASSDIGSAMPSGTSSSTDVSLGGSEPSLVTAVEVLGACARCCCRGFC